MEQLAAIVGHRVRSLRERMGLTLQTLADQAKMDVDELLELEAGRCAPRLGTILRVEAEAPDLVDECLHLLMNAFRAIEGG